MDDVHDVVFGFGAADDVVANRVTRVSAFEFGNGAEGFKHLAPHRGLRFGIQIAAKFLHDLGMQPGVLADVERVQVKSEFPYFPEERADVDVSEARAAVRLETLLDENQITLEFGSAGIRGDGAPGFARLAKLVEDVGKEATVFLVLVLRSPSEVNAGDGAFEELQPVEKGIGNRALTERGTDPVAQSFDIIEIFAQDQIARHGERMARAGGANQGITVTIAADPGSEVNDVGNDGLIELQSIDIA